MSDLPPDLDVSVDADEAELARLAGQVDLHLRLGRQADAARASDALLTRWPDSTTAHELAGDVAYAAGRIAEARTHYQRALEIEPANADAERKYGASLLAQTPEERRAALINQVIADPTAHRTGSRRPLNAVLNGMLFPGLGQLYNRQQEKGLVILAAAALTLILLLSVIMPYVSANMTVNSPNAKQAQVESAQQVINDTGVTQWLLVTLCGLVFLALYLWGIYDAWRNAQSDSERALGV